MLLICHPESEMLFRRTLSYNDQTSMILGWLLINIHHHFYSNWAKIQCLCQQIKQRAEFSKSKSTEAPNSHLQLNIVCSGELQFDYPVMKFTGTATKTLGEQSSEAKNHNYQISISLKLVIKQIYDRSRD